MLQSTVRANDLVLNALASSKAMGNKKVIDADSFETNKEIEKIVSKSEKPESVIIPLKIKGETKIEGPSLSAIEFSIGNDLKSPSEKAGCVSFWIAKARKDIEKANMYNPTFTSQKNNNYSYDYNNLFSGSVVNGSVDDSVGFLSGRDRSQSNESVEWQNSVNSLSQTFADSINSGPIRSTNQLGTLTAAEYRALKRRIITAVIKIQCIFRQRLAIYRVKWRRHEQIMRLRIISCISKWIRRYRVFSTSARRRRAATKIQKTIRGYLARRDLYAWVKAGVMLVRCYKRHLQFSRLRLDVCMYVGLMA